MQWLAAFVLLSLIFQPFDLERWAQPIVQPVNTLCLERAPDSLYRSWYQAIVCGINLPPSREKSWFQTTGLIHVIVVSGSHLVFLDEILARILGNGRIAGWIRWASLLLFSLASGLQPPVTRALVQRTCAWLAHRTHRPFPALHLQLLSGLVTLAFFPTWWWSLSFLMSWLCAFALSMPLPSNHPLLRSIVVYLVLLPAMVSIQFPNPASILFNFVFAPILGLVLFPMSLLAFVHGPLVWFCDKGWELFFWMFSALPRPDSAESVLFPVIWLLLYICVAQLGALYYVVQSRRRLWNSYLSFC